jgi:Secretion system C-terminal sorting domain
MRIKKNVTSNEWFGKLFLDRERLEDEAITAVKVYDKNGDLVNEINNLNTTDMPLPMNNLPQGTYSLEVFGKNDYKELHTIYYSLLNQEKNQTEDVALGNLNITGSFANERIYVMQQKLYSDLQSNKQAIEESLILERFVTENANSSFGIIFQIGAAFGNDDYDRASELLASWETTNDIDNNFKTYYKLFLTYQRTNVLDEDQLNQIHEIAIKCPLTDGEIVYAARSLYNYLSPIADDYSSACGNIGLRKAKNTNLSITQTSNAVYPNPSKGIITINNLASGTNTITINNMFGKIIQQKTTNSTIAMFNITSGNGVYTVQITNSTTGKIEIQKLIINK